MAVSGINFWCTSGPELTFKLKIKSYTCTEWATKHVSIRNDVINFIEKIVVELLSMFIIGNNKTKSDIFMSKMYMKIYQQIFL